MSKPTVTRFYRGYITRVWRKPALRQWGWEICHGEVRLDAGVRPRLDFALAAARVRIDEIVALENELACQNVADSADRDGDSMRDPKPKTKPPRMG